MGREIRRVPAGWEHPCNEKGEYIPKLKSEMPEEDATHYQIYEDVTEGTPVSPVFETLEEMKEWLLEEGHSEKATAKFIEYGWAPSFVVTQSGVSGLGIDSLDALE